MPVNPSLVSWRLRNVETHLWYEQDKQIMQLEGQVTVHGDPPLKTSP